VNDRRWFNNTQPQTLQIAVILLYIDAAFFLIFGGFLNPIGVVLIASMAGGAFGIANEKRWGYALGLFGAVFNLLWPLLLGASLADLLAGSNIINLMFGIALVALLLHPMSRDYQRIWFK
jgi:hypothetical protein